MNELDLVQFALIKLRPNNPSWFTWKNHRAEASWENAVSIIDGVTKPTKEEFDAKVAELQAAHDEANAPYKLKRAAEYPSIADQLDKIYHDGIDAWKADIKAVKDKYPKPE